MVDPSSGAQRQNAHDRIAADGFAAARHLDVGVEPVDALDEFGGGAGVQTFPVHDLHLAR